ncbi:MAG: hypothetical protein ACREA0_26015, partial [bacterium]
GLCRATCVLLLAMTILAASSGARDFTVAECPIVGNTETKIYHVRGGPNYRMMLQQNERKSRDNRMCFPTEKAAQDAGYRRAHN